MSISRHIAAAVLRRSWGLVLLARAPIELAEAEVAVKYEGTNSTTTAPRHGVTRVGGGFKGPEIPLQRDLATQPEGRARPHPSPSARDPPRKFRNSTCDRWDCKALTLLNVNLYSIFLGVPLHQCLVDIVEWVYTFAESALAASFTSA